ncbi:methyl-accepting chemotaxis protein [Gracilibacillus massiliensis]|uniref:methyl-accepting chemotaxis protein n=1 Tax=Gracilibacillus massiliensis TaxID=1564956 RepID=UPI00071C5AD4|nr:methyl-accepting chemotaxis protein [Gracilibacillus massiliensis]
MLSTLPTTVISDNLKLEAIYQNLAIIQFDTDCKVVDVNDLFRKTMKFDTNEQMLGKHHKEFCFDSFTNSIDYKYFWRRLLNGETLQDKINRKDALGNSIWLEATYMPTFENGRVVGVLKVATDITERQTNIQNFVQQLQVTSHNLSERANSGLINQEELNTMMEKMEQISNQNTNTLSDLQQQAKDIQGIVETIKNIASQTNLLSLNAAIEAAHAGEHGKGFAVVAQEVRKLSNKVEDSISEVNNNVTNITNEIGNISNGVMHIQEDIKSGIGKIHNATDDYQMVAKASETLTEDADKLSTIV